MKKILFMFSLFLAFSALNAQTIRVATYNIRYDNPRDSLDLWKNRSPFVADLIRLYDFDIFGIQEGMKHQLEYLKQKLKEYEYIGVGRDDGKEKGEFTAVFFKTARFKLLTSGNFWLSQVTDKPNKGWDAALPRICTWGRFEDQLSGTSFYMFNTHFDHMGQKARTESARLIVDMIREIAGSSPAILTGDFNFDETHPNFLLFRNSGLIWDTYELSELRYAPDGTFTAFDILAKPVGRIDHIFVTEGFIVKRYGILTNTYHARYPSDHFPVFSEITFPQ